jgi:hypothetical protein
MLSMVWCCIMLHRGTGLPHSGMAAWLSHSQVVPVVGGIVNQKTDAREWLVLALRSICLLGVVRHRVFGMAFSETAKHCTALSSHLRNSTPALHLSSHNIWLLFVWRRITGQWWAPERTLACGS